MATIIMRVDLDCDRCYKKIRKVLCKLQDRENIKMISYDEKSNTVTVSGSFDAEEVADRLCSDAGKVITDVQVARGKQMNPSAKVAPKQHGKEGHGHGPGPQAHGHGHGAGPQAHSYGGKPEKTKHVKFGMDDDERIDRHGPGPQVHGHGGKPDKTKHVQFGMEDDERIDRRGHHDQGHGQGHGHGHGNGHGGKPKVVTTTAMSRNEAPRGQQPASMAAMAPMRMPTPAPSMTMMPQAMATPSIWPAAPGWGYSAPAYGYGHAGGAPAGGYYGGPVYDHGAYGAYVGGYGRNPYQPQCYEEEPSAGCIVM
ncbi:filaggrin-2-like [Triticum urartu]|uniref:HMA domain-containing protein n=1 Tax=Triticum urartu TaxID=4572 RepID=A0A8R7Q2F2_TRIUA|nr:filaggrin-2-like [Triticum urartu]